MAYEESLKSISLNADSSLAVYTGVPGTPGSAEPNYGKQYTFVKVTGAHQVGLSTANTDNVVGVLQNKPQVEGQAATIGIFGVSNMIAGAAVAAGDKISSDATGRAVTTPGTGTPVVLGVALSASAGANQLISVLLKL
jgi:hypothetical protein